VLDQHHGDAARADTADELVDAVRTVAAGDSMLDRAVTGAVLERLRATAQDDEGGAFAELTEQERRVLAEVATGATNREIGVRLQLAEKTVRNYVSNVLAKLALESRAQAASYAVRHRLRELRDEATDA
jgi:DNA-binding NarL/FixJ family response regulator